MRGKISDPAFILKKSPFGEADEIITAYGQNQGKFRFLAKSVKKNNSKLQNRLQQLFLVRLEFVLGAKTGGLKKITGAEVLKTYADIRSEIFLTQSALYAVELFLKFLPDEEKSLEFFSLLEMYFQALCTAEKNDIEPLVAWLLARFLKFSGYMLAVEAGMSQGSGEKAYFSPAKGKFSLESLGNDSIPVNMNVVFMYGEFAKAVTPQKTPAGSHKVARELYSLLNRFLEDVMERQVKSSDFLGVSGSML